MPNYVRNRLEIVGDNDQVKEVLSFVRGEKGEDEREIFMDFNKIIPMPEELSIDSNNWLDPLENEFSYGDSFKDTLDKLKEVMDKMPDKKEYYKLIDGKYEYVEEE